MSSKFDEFQREGFKSRSASRRLRHRACFATEMDSRHRWVGKSRWRSCLHIQREQRWSPEMKQRWRGVYLQKTPVCRLEAARNIQRVLRRRFWRAWKDVMTITCWERTRYWYPLTSRPTYTRSQRIILAPCLRRINVLVRPPRIKRTFWKSRECRHDDDVIMCWILIGWRLRGIVMYMECIQTTDNVCQRWKTDPIGDYSLCWLGDASKFAYQARKRESKECDGGLVVNIPAWQTRSMGSSPDQLSRGQRS